MIPIIPSIHDIAEIIANELRILYADSFISDRFESVQQNNAMKNDTIAMMMDGTPIISSIS
jgi:hypothetical protein